MSNDRGLWLPDPAARNNVAAFAARVHRLDDSVVMRLIQRSAGILVAWAPTGFDVLACRVVDGSVKPADTCVGADALLRGLAAVAPDGHVETGFPLESAWRGALPPESGFVHIDDVPAAAVRDLADQGAELTREQGAHGPPVSLLDQEVLKVSGQGITIGVPMRCVFALTALGFIDFEVPDEVVRVRTLSAWLRIDARYGSVYRRRELLRLV